MRHILSRDIINAIIKEELETSRRYSALAKTYNLPLLESAARDEYRHAMIFQNILNRWR